MQATSEQDIRNAVKVLEEHDSNWRDLAKSLIIALLLAISLKSFTYEPFNIPSGSMKPNFLVGDYIIVSKFSYGYSRYSLPFSLPLIKDRILYTEPKRGDVIVFKTPKDINSFYIKRLIGLPGDEISIQSGKLTINGVPVTREDHGQYTELDDRGHKTTYRQHIETLPEGIRFTVLDDYYTGKLDFGRYTVPEDHYFFMGDNRDHSADSRELFGHSVIGYIPRDHLIGRVEMVAFSNTSKLYEVWKWVTSFKKDRFFKTDFTKPLDSDAKT